jgi:hypothetical protein
MENENPKGKVKFLMEGEFQKVGKFPWIFAPWGAKLEIFTPVKN